MTSGGGARASGVRRSPMIASMRASTLSVLASVPMASANLRERRGLTTATLNPLSCRLRCARRWNFPVASMTMRATSNLATAFLSCLRPAASLAQGEPLAEGVDVNVESGFTDVDADVDSRLGALLRRFLALHAGLAPHHLFRPSVKGRTDPAHPRFEAKGNTIPATRPSGGGHPPTVSPIQITFELIDHARGYRAERDGYVELRSLSRYAGCCGAPRAS